jgi:general secretion pathway protein G
MQPTTRSRRLRNEAAYTLFEIMLVLGIIAVLVGSAIYLLVGNVDVAKIQRVETDKQAITTQLKMYEMTNYAFPSTEQGLAALVTKPMSEPQPKRWTQLLTEVPLDPWGTPYAYASPGKKSTTGFDLYSLGPDRVESADDVGK